MFIKKLLKRTISKCYWNINEIQAEEDAKTANETLVEIFGLKLN